VRQKAINKVYSRIEKWNRMKNNRHLITFISGCILPADREQFLKLFDIVFPMGELPQLPDMISEYGVVSPAGLHLAGQMQPPGNPLKEFWHISPQYNSGFEAYIPIQNGCDKFCTFCAVPYTRGREVSRPSSEILAEIKELVARGYKSITLLGQNVNSYGLDKRGGEITFPDLLGLIGKFGMASGKQFWVYFTSPHPRDMTDEVIEVISKYPCVAKQIHLPVQSGDDNVLIRMNRKHNIEKYRHIVTTLRSLIPEATLFTDIIVGFTGETDEEFKNTMRIMEEFKYNMAYIARYSPRPGAASSRWADDVSAEVKKERYHLLSEKLRETSGKHNMDMVGREVTVLVRGKDRKPGYLSAYTEGRIITRFPAETDMTGSFARVRIIGAGDFSVEAELVSSNVAVSA
jgi:tRNA-2-methylthio-N6-dimethylallyladenosine synthase